MAMKPLFNENHVDQAYDTTLSVMRNYRNLSITQSKRYIVFFTAPGTITVQYWGRGRARVAGSGHGRHLHSCPPTFSSRCRPDFPTPARTASAPGPPPITVNNCALVGTNCLIFYPDGSAQDDLGNFNSGVVYLTRPGDMYSSRALSIFGTTGRVRGWRLYNQSGAKWVQQ